MTRTRQPRQTLRLAPLFADLCAVEAPDRDADGRVPEPLALRARMDAAMTADFAASAPAPDVARRDAVVFADDGAPVPVRWYTDTRTSRTCGPGPAVVYFHGGGLIGGSVEVFDHYVAQYVQWSGVPFLSVDYRLAPEASGETPARDGLAALRWLHEDAVDLGVDPRRIAVMGDSAGGGIAAAVAVLARDAGVRLSHQVLVFPMLDDRTTTADPHLLGSTTWTHLDNLAGWRALLGDRAGGPAVSAVEAPGRLQDAHGLAPAYLEVGSLDIFRDECVAYAGKLWAAGVEAELHVHPGAPHGYDGMALDSAFTRRWRADRVRVLRSL
ncbi:alpha/beta hydrolase fold domain-containing protein [Kineococcus sp. DHX-1]|uniref:alpha/beta hydrolase fold domain-containing protein n=1 Tax=Kineococcus sp. DHX-1 TaxID=3349638 RepID=UPI0036D3464A